MSYRHYLDEFGIEPVCSKLAEPPTKHILSQYPGLSKPPQLSRLAIRLIPDNSKDLSTNEELSTNDDDHQQQHQTSISSNRFLGKSAIDIPLSEHNLWHHNQYRSFNPLQRIGLPKSFREDLINQLNDETIPPMTLINKTDISDMILSYLRTQKETIKAQYQHGNNLFIKIELAFIDPDPIVTQSASRHTLTLGVKCTLPIKKLAIPLFSIPISQTLIPDLLPNIQLFTINGDEFPKIPSNDWGPPIDQARKANLKYIAFNGQLFKIAYGLPVPQPTRSPNNETVNYFIHTGTRIKSCEACQLHPADLEVTGSLILPISPTYLCIPCYNELFPINQRNDDNHAVASLLPDNSFISG